MNPNKSSLIKKMNQLMLEYADDIVPVERKQVTDFFEEINISYREDYIDFLARFGGNYSKMFQRFEFDCTFQEIKEIYLENAVYDPVPPDGYCIIGNQLMADAFIIENDTGKIFNKYPTEYKPIIGEADFENIDVFLWGFLYFTYLDNFKYQGYTKVLAEELDILLPNNKLVEIGYWRLSVYIKENKVYLYYKGTDSYKGDNEVFIHTLTDDFVKRLYE